MRRKKIFLLSVALLMVSVIFGGCLNKKKDPNKVLDFLKDMDSYSTDITLDIKNDKQVITHEAKQFYKKGLGYRMELGTDRVFVYKGDKIEVSDIKNNLKYTTEKDFDSLFKLSFIGEYIGLLYTNEEFKYSYKNINEKEYQIIHLIIPGGTREISKASLWVDMKTSLPEELIIYDEKENERVKVTYKNFVPNAELKNEIFKVN